MCYPCPWHIYYLTLQKVLPMSLTCTETSYMDTVWDTVQEQVKAAEAKQKAKAQKER